MLNYLIPIIAGGIVFMVFMLVFLRRDERGNRGGRLAGCAHHKTDEQCDCGRDKQMVTIRSHPPNQQNNSVGNPRQGAVKRQDARAGKTRCE